MITSINNHIYYSGTDASGKTTFVEKLEKEEDFVKTGLKKIICENGFNLEMPFMEYYELEKKKVGTNVINLVFDRCSIDFLVYRFLMENIGQDIDSITGLLEIKYGTYLNEFVKNNGGNTLIYLSTNYDTMKERMLVRGGLSDFDKKILESPELFNLYKNIFDKVIVKICKTNEGLKGGKRMNILRKDSSISLF